MNMHIAFSVLISVLCGCKDAKIIRVKYLDFNTEIMPLNLDIHEARNNFEGDSSAKKDLNAEKYKDGLKFEAKPYFDNDGAKIPVKVINKNDEIEREFQVGIEGINVNSNYDVTNINDLNASEEKIRITNIVLSKISELLGNEELQSSRRGEEYTAYVPVSEDMVNPDFIPQELRASVDPVKKDGLILIDLEGRAQR